MIDSNEKCEFQKELNRMIGFLYSDNNSNYKPFRNFIEFFCQKYFNTISEVEINHFLKELDALEREENFTPAKKKEIAVKLSVFFKFLHDAKDKNISKISLWRRFVNFILSLFCLNPQSNQAHKPEGISGYEEDDDGDFDIDSDEEWDEDEDEDAVALSQTGATEQAAPVATPESAEAPTIAEDTDASAIPATTDIAAEEAARALEATLAAPAPVELSLVSGTVELAGAKEGVKLESQVLLGAASISDVAEQAEIKENGSQAISAPEISEVPTVTIEEAPASVELVEEKATEKEINPEDTLAPEVLAESVPITAEEEIKPEVLIESQVLLGAAPISEVAEPIEVIEEVKLEVTLASQNPVEPSSIAETDVSALQAPSKKTADEYGDEFLFKKCVPRKKMSKSDSFITASIPDTELSEAEEEEKVKPEAPLALLVSSVPTPISAESKAEPMIQASDKKGEKEKRKSLLGNLAPSIFKNKKKEGQIISEEALEKGKKEITETDFVNKAIEYVSHIDSLNKAKKEKRGPEIERIKKLIKTEGQELLKLLPAAEQAVACETKKEIDPFIKKAIDLAQHISSLDRVKTGINRTRIKKLIKTKGKELLEIYSKNNDEKEAQTRRNSGSSLFKVANEEKSTETNSKGTEFYTHRF